MQETLLAAWRGLDRLRGACRAAHVALPDRDQPLPERAPRSRAAAAGARRVPPETPAPPAPTRLGEPLWLEPYPDALLDGVELPESRHERREAIGLAFVAGLQQLPPRQRAALVLRDMLGFSARETAEMLDTTETAANGLLGPRPRRVSRPARRASVGAAAGIAPRSASSSTASCARSRPETSPACSPLLADDALLTMPPEPLEYDGPAAIGALPLDGSGGRQARSVHPRSARARTVSRPSAATCATRTRRSRTPTA